MTDNDSSQANGSPQQNKTGHYDPSVRKPPRYQNVASKEAHPGMIIDRRYRLVRKLGEGGMGVVWQAKQEVIDRPVAIKLLHSSLISSPEVQARFEVEARAIGRLRHSNCVTLFDFGRSQALDSCFMVLEYVEGNALADLMSGREFTLHEILEIGIQTADALDHAHQQGIIHRDVKPENIMLTGDDNAFVVKVLDFGIARLVDNSADGEEKGDQRQGRITRAGQVFGTPVYMAPEQATGKYTFGPQCDIYSLGIILYELIEGHPPFDDEQPVAILLKHVTDPLPPILREDIPTELRLLIYEMLEKAPADRTKSARAVKDRLLEIDMVLHPERHMRASNSFIGITQPHNLPPLEDFDDAPVSSRHLPLREQIQNFDFRANSKLIAIFLVSFVAFIALLFVIWGLTTGTETDPEISNASGVQPVTIEPTPDPSHPDPSNEDPLEPGTPAAPLDPSKSPETGDPKKGAVDQHAPPKHYEMVGPPLIPSAKPEKKEEKEEKARGPKRKRRNTRPPRHHNSRPTKKKTPDIPVLNI